MNIYDIWFSRVEITNSIKLRLLQKFESSEIWNLSRNDLIELKLKEVTIKKILDLNYKKNLEKYKEYLEKHKIILLSYKDELYPKKLKYILDKPVYIFVIRKCKYFR